MRRLILPLSFGILGFVILMSLGVWQIQRLHWKEGILADIAARIAAPPVPLPAHPQVPGDRYLPVTVTGGFTGKEIEVLASTRDDGAGVRVIAAFLTDTGRKVMVDRGFLPEDLRGQPRTVTEITITGNLHWPDEKDGFTPPPDARTGLWFARDVPAMAEKLATEPVLIVARNDTGDQIRPMPVDTSGIPNDHLGYALQWFGMAAVWAGMTGLYLWRIRRRTV
ncbi:MAG: SURF1 family protein [Paracoccaceae bacterium]